MTAAFNVAFRQSTALAVSDRFDVLSRQASEAIDRGNVDDAKKSIFEMQGRCFDEARKNPGFVVDAFLDLSRERHLAIDKTLHDRLVENGKLSIEHSDLGSLRSVIAQMLQNRYPTDVKESRAPDLAGLIGEDWYGGFPMVSDRP
jgi:hypothetical protein